MNHNRVRLRSLTIIIDDIVMQKKMEWGIDAFSEKLKTEKEVV